MTPQIEQAAYRAFQTAIEHYYTQHPGCDPQDACRVGVHAALVDFASRRSIGDDEPAPAPAPKPTPVTPPAPVETPARRPIPGWLLPLVEAVCAELRADQDTVCSRKKATGRDFAARAILVSVLSDNGRTPGQIARWLSIGYQVVANIKHRRPGRPQLEQQVLKFIETLQASTD